MFSDFADTDEPELLALHADDLNASSGSLHSNISSGKPLLDLPDITTSDPGSTRHQRDVLHDEAGEEDNFSDTESLMMQLPMLSPAKMEWMLAESDSDKPMRILIKFMIGLDESSNLV